ncbi:MAG: anti-phage dCTP deaminase [Vicinamibacterales bacterium]
MPAQPPVTSFDYPESELVFGVTALVGTDISQLQSTLDTHLKRFGYRLNGIKLSTFLQEDAVVKRHRVDVAVESEYRRISTLMDAGNKTREVSGRPDVMALYAASAISESRNWSENPTFPAVVHLMDSLKRPEEVAVLRRIYGPGFFLIGVYSPEVDRKAHLEERGMSRDEADNLIERDRDEGVKTGQRTRATFHLADVIVRLDRSDLGLFKNQVKRFVDLVFGNPFETPTADEHAMFLAYAASFRSADLSRQVGAVVVSEAGEVIATGANDVPQFGGGLYWPGPQDQRDHVRGTDSNKAAIEGIVRDIVQRITPGSRQLTSEEIEGRLAGGQLHDLTEFGRMVHAEMEAIASCARVGVSTRKGVMYTTTFPCHNCAKHIVAAGIREVQYVEPYPKSRASELHGDSISVEVAEEGKVLFKPFVGVTARRYVDLFSLQLGSGRNLVRKVGSQKAVFERMNAAPRVPMPPASYLEREKIATSNILITMSGGEQNAKGKKTTSRRRKDRNPKQGG